MPASTSIELAQDPESPPPVPSRTRRSLLAGLLGGVGALIAGAMARVAPASAAVGDSLILGQTNSAGGSATRLSTSSSGGAFWATQNGSGSGVRGESINGTGGVFETRHADRQGLLAQNIATSVGNGAALRAAGGFQNGIVASTDSSTAVALTATNFSGTAVRGESIGWIGVSGVSSDYIGAVGASVNNIGVYGASTNSIGVQGFSNNNASYAGSFVGNVSVTGTLSKGGGSFRIDHPLDPANKLLQHSFVESPDMMNIYNGNVTTDASGEATVSLPDWFEALNRDFRYQITPIGAAMPNLHVSTELANGRFNIAGGVANASVSWQLTGIRKDAWAEAHRIEVELGKSGSDKGRFLHPLEHGQPESSGVDYAMRQKLEVSTPTR